MNSAALRFHCMTDTNSEDRDRKVPRERRAAWIVWGRVGRLLLGIIGVLAMIVLLFPGTRIPRQRVRIIGPDARLAQLSLAINAYTTQYKQYPRRAVCSDEGTPLLSWRVLLLPFLGERQLFSDFRLDEPWDSPHNRALLPRRPSVFDNPLRSNLPPTHTAYLALQGPGALLTDDASGIPLDGIRDGMANVAILAETLEGDVPWTQPVDIDITKHPRIGDQRGISGILSQGAYVAFLDGKAEFLPSHCPEDLLRALVTTNGGERVPSRPDRRRVIDELSFAKAAEHKRDGALPKTRDEESPAEASPP